VEVPAPADHQRLGSELSTNALSAASPNQVAQACTGALSCGIPTQGWWWALAKMTVPTQRNLAITVCFAQPAPGSDAQIKLSSLGRMHIAASMRIQQARLRAILNENTRMRAKHNQEKTTIAQY
jgi:hypothetical protein